MFWFLVPVVIAALADAAPGPNHSYRIINGTDTTIEAHPHQIALFRYGEFKCGGSIIGPNYVITAAHCTFGFPANIFKIRVGSSKVNEGGTVVDVKKVVDHPKYGQFPYAYDISVITLAEPLEFSSTVAPIALPDNDAGLAPGTIVTVTGWGRLNTVPFPVPTPPILPEVLQKIETVIVDHQKCKSAYLSFRETVTDDMLCAGDPEAGKAACQGDSGGPLTCDGKLYGIMSWGGICFEHLVHSPSVFTDVVYFLDFIREQTPGL